MSTGPSEAYRRYYHPIAAIFVLIILINLSVIGWRKVGRSNLVIETQETPLSMRIDPNTAEAADWESLPGISAQVAKAIYEYRLEHQYRFPGQPTFTTLEDLTNVKGIGEKSARRIGSYLIFPETSVP